MPRISAERSYNKAHQHCKKSYAIYIWKVQKQAYHDIDISTKAMEKMNEIFERIANPLKYQNERRRSSAHELKKL